MAASKKSVGQSRHTLFFETRPAPFCTIPLALHTELKLSECRISQNGLPAAVHEEQQIGKDMKYGDRWSKEGEEVGAVAAGGKAAAAEAAEEGRSSDEWDAFERGDHVRLCVRAVGSVGW